MNARRNTLAPRILAALFAFIATSSQAAPVTKSATGTDLTAGASWGGTAPGSGDVATWTGTSLGAGLTLGSSRSWSGISVAGAASAIGVTGAGTLTLGPDGINMSAATVNLTLGTPLASGCQSNVDRELGQDSNRFRNHQWPVHGSNQSRIRHPEDPECLQHLLRRHHH